MLRYRFTCRELQREYRSVVSLSQPIQVREHSNAASGETGMFAVEREER
jgi:hypothetical protein